MDLTSQLYNPQFNRGAYTTRPSTAKKIDLDPISRRTINPEYNIEETRGLKPRKILQPSNILNQYATNLNGDHQNSLKNYQNPMQKKPSTPKANVESQMHDLPVKRVLKACDLKNYDYSSQIASLPFGNHQRPAQNDLSMMPRSNCRANSSNPSWMMKQMNDYRSELENLPGCFNSRISKQDPFSVKSAFNYSTRNMLTSPEMNKNMNDGLRKKFPSENEKRCVKELDIRESKVKQFDEKKNFLRYSHEENPIIKQELMKGKPKETYPNAFKSTLQLY